MYRVFAGEERRGHHETQQLHDFITVVDLVFLDLLGYI
jgi:hypothetical protein